MPAEEMPLDAKMAPAASPRDVAMSSPSPQDDLLDAPLSSIKSSELSTFGLGESDSESDLEADEENGSADKKQKKDKKEKKHKKDKKHKRHKRKPRLIRDKDTKAGLTKMRTSSKGNSLGQAVPEKKEGVRQKVLKVVAEYIEEKGDNWTASVMREEISEKYGWENNGEFTTNVKIALQSLGIGLGGNRMKGA